MSSQVKNKILLYKVRTAKDRDAFAELYDDHVDSVYRFVYFKLSDRAQAEDVTSEVFLRAWDYLTKTPDRSINSFRGLVYKIARNCVIDIYRERSKSKEYSIEALRGMPDESSDIERQTDVKNEYERLTDAIGKLKQEYREVIQLKYIEGLSVREICAVLGKKSSAVRVTLHRAVKKLKQITDGEL